MLSPLFGRGAEVPVSTVLEALDKRVTALEERKPAVEFEMHGVMIGGIQSLSVRNSESGFKRTSRGGFAFQPEFLLSPTRRDEFGSKFGFAAGNGLNGKSPFNLSTWAADLEDDVIDMNGGNRSYLLTSWYKRKFELGGWRGEAVGGIIDATDYLVENAYANDELSQFMNEALVNAPNGFAPSYDLGGAVRFGAGPVTLSGVTMRVPKDEHDHPSRFFGAQAAARVPSRMGEGNLRVSLETSDKECPTVDPNVKKARRGVLISADQALGSVLGVWTRLGVHNKDVIVNYRYLYSGGFNLRGRLWNRPGDDIGIGRAVPHKGTNGISRSEVTEVYARCPIDDVVALRVDAQYLKDHRTLEEPHALQGWVTGLTLAASF